MRFFREARKSVVLENQSDGKRGAEFHLKLLESERTV
jgi:hypothetical protein